MTYAGVRPLLLAVAKSLFGEFTHDEINIINRALIYGTIVVVVIFLYHSRYLLLSGDSSVVILQS
jgi:hypothetical protein